MLEGRQSELVFVFARSDVANFSTKLTDAGRKALEARLLWEGIQELARYSERASTTPF